MAVLIYGAWRKVKRPFQGLSTFDMDQLGKISRHHEKVVKLLSLKVIRLKRGSHSSASYENLQTLDTWGQVLSISRWLFISFAQTLGKSRNIPSKGTNGSPQDTQTSTGHRVSHLGRPCCSLLLTTGTVPVLPSLTR